MNQLLVNTKAAILKKADPRLVPAINKIVAAGQKVMYADSTRQMLKQQLGNGKDPETIGAGIAKLAGILYHQSKRQLPPQILIPSAGLLLLEGLQFLEDAGTVKVDANFLAECTKSMGSALAQLFGATPDKLQGMITQAQAQKSAQPAAPPAAPPGIIAGAQQGGM
jgi:hypothetical protein